MGNRLFQRVNKQPAALRPSGSGPPSLESPTDAIQGTPTRSRQLDASERSLLIFFVYCSQKNKNVSGMFHQLRSLGPVLLACLSIAACATAPPVQEMSDARQAISAAEEAEAQTYAPTTLSDARRYLAEAEQLLQDEAYGPARMNAVRARNRAVRALQLSQAAAAEEREKPDAD